MFALQYARLSGCHVLTTCSPGNMQLVKALGAHEAFDYHDGVACAAAIRAATSDNLLYAVDCVAAGSTLQICADALTTRPDEATYTASMPVGDKFPRKDVRCGWTSGYTGEYLHTILCRFGRMYTNSPLAFGEIPDFLAKLRPLNVTDVASAADFWKMTAELLRQDRLRLGPLVQSREGGLAGIPKGLSELRSGRVTAGKLVYGVN